MFEFFMGAAAGVGVTIVFGLLVFNHLYPVSYGEDHPW